MKLGFNVGTSNLVSGEKSLILEIVDANIAASPAFRPEKLPKIVILPTNLTSPIISAQCLD
jgi:hypothetical protein